MASPAMRARSYWYAVKERVRAHPEVEDAAIVTAAPLGGRVNETNYNATPGIAHDVAKRRSRILRDDADSAALRPGVRCRR